MQNRPELGLLGSWNRILYTTLITVLAASSFPSCRSVLINRTIDSHHGDSVTGIQPIYLVAKAGGPGWDDETCTPAHCFIQPDPNLAFDHSWRAITYTPDRQNVSITLRFTGVAIWVFFILANANINGPGTTTNTQCNFTLDGQYAGNFSHDPDISTFGMVYNATVFSKADLANAPHQLIISTNDYPINTFLNFDYAIYTADVDMASTLTSATSSPSAPILSSSTTAQTLAERTAITFACIFGAGVITTIALLFIRFAHNSQRSVAHKDTLSNETSTGTV